MTYDSTADTQAHIKRVQNLIEQIRIQLQIRAAWHDGSKLEVQLRQQFILFLGVESADALIQTIHNYAERSTRSFETLAEWALNDLAAHKSRAYIIGWLANSV